MVTCPSKTFAKTQGKFYATLIKLQIRSFLNDSPRGTYFKKGNYRIQINANWKKFSKRKN